MVVATAGEASRQAPPPYYRLEAKYGQEGLDPSLFVLCESTTCCAELLEPIAEALRKEVIEWVDGLWTYAHGIALEFIQSGCNR